MSHKQLKDIAEADAIYFAGFFDGEGSVGIYERALQHCGPGAANPQVFVGIRASNTHRSVIEHLKRTCGGCIGKPTKCRVTKKGTLRKPVWQWAALSREAIHILKQVYPFLIVKREQAKLAFEFQELVMEYVHRPHPDAIGKRRLSAEELEKRRSYIHRMKALKEVQFADS